MESVRRSGPVCRAVVGGFCGLGWGVGRDVEWEGRGTYDPSSQLVQAEEPWARMAPEEGVAGYEVGKGGVEEEEAGDRAEDVEEGDGG